MEIDNNASRAIRPTAVGKKKWLLVGGEDTGERCAVIYTLIESAKRHGHVPYTYLKGVLERLPSLKSSGIGSLLPANWQSADQAMAPLKIAG